MLKTAVYLLALLLQLLDFGLDCGAAHAAELEVRQAHGPGTVRVIRLHESQRNNSDIGSYAAQLAAFCTSRSHNSSLAAYSEASDLRMRGTAHIHFGYGTSDTAHRHCEQTKSSCWYTELEDYR